MFRSNMSTVNYKPSSITTAVRVRPGLTSHFDDNYVGAMGFGNFLRFGDQALQPAQNDYVYGADLPQEFIFECSVKKYLDKFLKGQDVSVIAYGAHHTGKSYTIFGPGFHFTDSEMYYGMLPKAISYIFSKFGPWDNVWAPHIKISMCEVYTCGIRDLSEPNSEIVSYPTFTTNEKGLLTLNLIKRDCFSAMEAIQIIRMGLSNRAVRYELLNNLGTAIVILELHKPEIKGGEVVRSVVSQAVFVDTACYDIMYPMDGDFLHFDVHVLTLLANSQGNQIPSVETEQFQNCLPFKMFQDFFNGKMDTFIICCISPRKDDVKETSVYLSVLWGISKSKPKKLSSGQTENMNSEEPNEPSAYQTDQTHISTTLMSEAAKLFSRLSTNRSVSEEDREMMRKWMEMKQDLVDETVNAQSHLQLERIEEVTESEEELASSDGKVSEQDNSEDHSGAESDQEDLDHKINVLSDSDFLENIEDLYDTFCSFVDSQVDTFEMQTVFPPTSEQKPPRSAIRRGGLQHLPITTPQSKLIQGPSTVQANTSATQTDVSQNSTGAASTSGEEYFQHQVVKSSVAQNQHKREQTVTESKSDLSLQTYEQENLALDFARKCKISVDRNQKSASQAVKNLNGNMELSDHLSSTNNRSSEADEETCSISLMDHRLRTFRSVRDKVNVIKGDLHTKIKSKIFSEDELKSYLIADETVDTLDRGNEFLNCLRLKNKVPYPEHAHLEVWKMAEDVFQQLLTPNEISQILTYYFIKLVDLRVSTFQMEELLSSQERSLHACHTKINNLNATILNLRNHKMVKTDVDHYKPYTNKKLTNTLSRRDEEGACGGAASTIPQQNLSKLQVNKREPPPKVMRSQNNKKLVVELNRKKH